LVEALELVDPPKMVDAHEVEDGRLDRIPQPFVAVKLQQKFPSIDP
jgi:hypothetical protein